MLRTSAAERNILERCLAWLRIGALALAATQTAKIIAKACVVAGSLGEFPWSEYAATAQFQAGFARVLLSSIIAACAFLPLRTRSGWLVLVH